jgi:hypothetical protein
MAKDYDKIIVGSDQVWHYMNIYHKSHTLDFAGSRESDKPKKYSYAASFGADRLETDEAVEYVRKLADFDMLTVREPGGVDILRQYAGRDDVQVAIDPTLLLDKEQWTSLAVQSNYKHPEHYIFVYSINEEKGKLKSFAQDLARKNGCPVIFVHRATRSGWLLYGTEQKRINPCDWVNLIRNADYVVTDSFHGTAFSIIFEKRFFVNASSQPGRMMNILRQCGISGRELAAYPNEKDIDYTAVRERLQPERERCLSLLKKMLEA